MSIQNLYSCINKCTTFYYQYVLWFITFSLSLSLIKCGWDIIMFYEGNLCVREKCRATTIGRESMNLNFSFVEFKLLWCVWVDGRVYVCVNGWVGLCVQLLKKYKNHSLLWLRINSSTICKPSEDFSSLSILVADDLVCSVRCFAEIMGDTVSVSRMFVLTLLGWLYCATYSMRSDMNEFCFSWL